MTPIDYRNANWSDLQSRLRADCLQVYDLWLRFGPKTTAELAAASGFSLLTLRPRTTDLYQLGLVELVPGFERKRAGVYQAVPISQAEIRFNQKKQEVLNVAVQTQLQL
jgi:hypothetical protein